MSWSPYDEAVPQPQALDHVRPVFERLRRQRGADPDRLRLVRDVVVVASSSRGGSSLLGALLRRVDGLLHLPSEMNPHVVLATLEPGRELEVLAAEVAADIGVPGDVLDPLDVEWRLAAQWPHGGEIDVRYYDVPLEGPPPEGPPSPSFVEMPPFVVARPWRRVRPDAGTLVLTTPRSSFRLDLLRALFPDARFRVLHLTRRPEAAVNGLLDGWRHHGFWNCVSPTGRWWSFDYVPDWRRWEDEPLVDLCAEQWRAPHAATLEFLERTGVESLRVRHEDVAGGDPVTFRRLADWLGVPGVADLAEVRLPPVMATKAPSPGRWQERADAILPAIGRPEVAAMAATLGYDVDPGHAAAAGAAG